MAKIYQTIKVTLKDTDAAGILFYANQFIYAHEVYELFLERIGYPMGKVISGEDFFIPIVHAGADFSGQLAVGDQVEICLEIEKIGKASYTLAYQIRRLSGELIGKAQTVHVTVDKKTGKKIPLPLRFHRALENFRAEE